MSPQGVMFYSTDPASDGNALTPEETTIYRASAPRTLPATGGQDGSVTMRALILAALGLGLMATGLAVRRRLA